MQEFTAIVVSDAVRVQEDLHHVYALPYEISEFLLRLFLGSLVLHLLHEFGFKTSIFDINIIVYPRISIIFIWIYTNYQR